ncbi:MAG: M23 family metallopeptidase [Bdellovibrionales bacterium]
MRKISPRLWVAKILASLILICGSFFAQGGNELLVTKDLRGLDTIGDDCLKKCIGCPFHEHRYFYKYSLLNPTIETDTKGIFPVIYGGDVISKVGDPRDGGLRKHRGIDIAAKPGSSIVAAWTGKVQFAGWDMTGGWAVILRHKNGYVTYYAHLKSKPSVRPGQRIVAGQRLGSLGQSGNAAATVPHLHFEVLNSKGGVINPLQVL